MTALVPINLKCENLTNPAGLNGLSPRFSWALGCPTRENNKQQTAYQILVGESRELIPGSAAIYWESTKVTSAQSLYIPYAGKALRSNQHLFWTVRVWDEQGVVSIAAEVQSFVTGLLFAEDFSAHWIARYFVLPAGREIPADNQYDNPWQARPADYLRTEVCVPKSIYRATAYLTALGLYEFYINGHRVGEDVMAPGWTDYHQRVEYQTHDVTSLLNSGDNALGAIIAEGWYSGRIGHNQRRAGNHYGGRPAFWCKIVLEYTDGSTQQFISDRHWRTKQGAICYSDFLMGELYDARLEMPAWHCVGFAQSTWQPVEVFSPEPNPPKIEAARCEPSREISEHCTQYLHQTTNGGYIFDAGQNLSGYVRLEMQLARGTKVTLRHGEILDEKGELYTQNLRHAVSTDHYIGKGEGVEVFKPHFTFHGFRYVELSSSAAVTLAKVKLTAIAIGTAMQQTGSIKTGQTMVNQLLSNILWSQKGNFLSVPTDCPQRDERLGWSADAQVFWRTAGYNMDISAFLDKWFEDIVDAQLADGAFTDIVPSRPLNPYRQSAQPGAPGWGDAPVILAWQHYLRYGDGDLVAKHYGALLRWMAHIAKDNPDYIRNHHVYNNYGDWLSVGPSSDRCMVATAYWVYIADIMAKISKVLGFPTDQQRFETLAKNIRRAFIKRFVDDAGVISGDTQSGYLLAIDFKILTTDLAAQAAKHLVRTLKSADNHLQTGFLGVKHLCPVLSDIAQEKTAYQLLLNDSYPSWGFSIKQGATTIWERWDGWTAEKGFQSVAMNSFNHYAYGAVGEWLYARMAGIDWDEEDAGFKSIIFRPIFNRDIGWVKAEYQARRGLIKSHWRYHKENIEWRISIPPNCQGKVVLSRRWRQFDAATAPLKIVEDDNTTIYLYGSGDYCFTLTAKN